MRTPFAHPSHVLPLAFAFAFALGGCTSDDNGGPAPAETADASTHATEDAGSSLTSDAMTPSGRMTTFRVAHLARDLPTLDFCYRAIAGDTWVGPVLEAPAPPRDASPPAWADAGEPSVDASFGDASDAIDAGDAYDGEDAKDARIADAEAEDASSGDASAMDAGDAAALGYLDVTAYTSVSGSGTFEIALLGAGARSCANPLAHGRVTLDAGKHTTIAIMGEAHLEAGATGALAIVGLTDDPAVMADVARVRFVNAALDADGDAAAPTMSASIDAKGTSIAIAAEIDPMHAATPSGASPVVDALGYHATSAIAPPASVQLTGGQASWASAAADLDLRAGSIHSAFIVLDDATGFAIVWCDDASIASPLATCAVLR